MSNGYYSHTTYPPTNSSGASAPMRSELDALMAGFDLLPDPLGIGQKGFNGGTFNNPTIQNGSINGTAIGTTAVAAAHFTTLMADGLATLSGGGSFKGTYTALLSAILAGFVIQGGSLDNTPIGNTTRNLGKFTTLDTTGAVHIGGALTIDGALSSGTGGLEIGNPAVAGASFVDFHSSGASSDYDGRILVTGGNATPGQATMSYSAAAHVFSARPSWLGAVPWDTTTLPSPVQTSGATFSGDVGLNAAGTVSPNFRFSTNGGGYKAYMRANAGGGTLEFINNAYSAVNASIRDDGYLSVRNGANFGLRPTWQGFIPWDNSNLTALSQLTNNMGFINAGATVAGANSVNGITFAISGQGGQPAWLWGYDGSSLQQKLWSPSTIVANNAIIRNGGNREQGYVGNNSNNSIIMAWNNGYQIFTDDAYQGNLVTTGASGPNNFQGEWRAQALRSSEIGTYIHSKTPGGHPINYGTNVGIPGFGGTWQSRSNQSGFDEQTYIRIA